MGVSRNPLQPCGASAENIVGRIRGLGRPSGLRSDQLDAKRVGDPTRDLVLQGEEIAGVAIEWLGPQMRVALGVDQLRANAYLLARSLDAPLQHITHTELAADPARVDGPVTVGQRGVARDHEHALEPGEIGRQILGNAIDKIRMLLWIVADIDERQHGD